MRAFNFQIKSLSPNRNGFTLIELLIVIALIGILSAIGMPSYYGFKEQSKINSCKANFDSTYKNYISIMQKCADNATLKIMNKPSDTTYYNTSCSKDKFVLYSDEVINHLNNISILKNIYKSDGNNVLQPGSCSGSSYDGNAGFIWIFGDEANQTISICSCCKVPCSSPQNRLSSFLPIE